MRISHAKPTSSASRAGLRWPVVQNRSGGYRGSHQVIGLIFGSRSRPALEGCDSESRCSARPRGPVRTRRGSNVEPEGSTGRRCVHKCGSWSCRSPRMTVRLAQARRSRSLMWVPTPCGPSCLPRPPKPTSRTNGEARDLAVRPTVRADATERMIVQGAEVAHAIRRRFFKWRNAPHRPRARPGRRGGRGAGRCARLRASRGDWVT